MTKKILLIFLLFASCNVPKKINPKINYFISENYINSLQTAFDPLTKEEKKEAWAKEYIIAKSLAKDFDLYRAITTFKRAKILIPKNKKERIDEITYDILLCYFLGKKYQKVIDIFENSSLENIDKSFPVFSDLLVILYQSYEEVEDFENAQKIKKVLNNNYKKISDKITASLNILNANINSVKTDQKNLIKNYELKKKSVQQAQLLNTLIPGAGYLYLGQKRAFLTSILLNASFIAASIEFFRRGYVAAGIITTSFEMGWYFGGIYGAGEEAKFYNERIYAQEAQKTLSKEKLYPFFMVKHSF